MTPKHLKLSTNGKPSIKMKVNFSIYSEERTNGGTLHKCMVFIHTMQNESGQSHTEPMFHFVGGRVIGVFLWLPSGQMRI